MISQEHEATLGQAFSCPHCNAVAHQDWYSLFLKPENATDVVVLTLEALMLAKGTESDQFLQHLKCWPMSTKTVREISRSSC